jgi:hypothetical protein
VFRRTAVLLLFRAVIGGTLACAAATTASAATYYATPHPAVGATCAAASPCELLMAVGKAGTGDDVQVAGGAYFKDEVSVPYPDLIEVKPGVVVHGTPGAALPVIHGVVNGNAMPFIRVAAAGTLRDVEIVMAPGSTGLSYAYGVSLTADSLLERAIVRATGNGATYINSCSMVGGTIRDSACLGDGGGIGGSVIAVAATASGSATYELRNVTAISTAPVGEGIRMGTATGTAVMTASNVIARGVTNDVFVNAGLASGTATLVIDHSNWTTESLGSGMGVRQIIKGAGNQTGATAATPLFVDAAAGDYRVEAASPTVDAGVDDDANGQLALGGTARTLGARTDIGAYEYDPTPPAPAPPASPGGGTTTAPPTTTTPSAPVPVVPSVDLLAPTISSLSIGRTWRAGSKLATVSAAKRPPVGTSIRITVSEAASMTLAFSQPKTGRKAGGRCRAKTTKNVGKPRCTIANARGTLTRPARAGTNIIKFFGRLSTAKRLKPGSYLLTATAVDGAENRSRARTTRFRIVR